MTSYRRSRILLSIILSECFFPSCTPPILRHHVGVTPSLQIQGAFSTNSRADTVRLIQQVGPGGVDAFVLLREPFLKELLKTESYENSSSRVRVITLHPDGTGTFAYTLPSLSFYAAGTNDNNCALGMLSLVVSLPDHPDKIFGIEFDCDQERIFKFNQREWEFEAIEHSTPVSPIVAELSPKQDIRTEARKLVIIIQ